MKRKGKDWRDKFFTLKSQGPPPKWTKKDQKAFERALDATYPSHETTMPILPARDAK